MIKSFYYTLNIGNGFPFLLLRNMKAPTSNCMQCDIMSIRIPEALPTTISPKTIRLLRQFTYDNLPTTSIRLRQISIFTKFIASLA